MRDAWVRSYYDVLAKDIGTDASSLKGQEWINQMPYGHRFYTDTFNDNIAELEKRLKKRK